MDIRGANFATNVLYWKVLKDAARMSSIIGREVESKRWRGEAEKVSKKLKNNFWDDFRGVYVDNLIDGQPSSRASEHGNYLALLFGLADEQQANRMLDELLDDSHKIAELSPNLFHYLGLALIKYDRVSEMLRITRSRFARMYQEKSDTIWEGWSYNGRLTMITSDHKKSGTIDVGESSIEFPNDFMPEDYFLTMDQSMVQGACVGMSYVLSTEILGIKAAQPGFAKIRIEPHIGDLTWARGAFPSAKGTIKVDWRRMEGEFRIKVQVPADCTPFEVVLPVEKGDVEKIVVDGKDLVAEAGKFSWNSGKLVVQINTIQSEITIDIVK